MRVLLTNRKRVLLCLALMSAVPAFSQVDPLLLKTCINSLCPDPNFSLKVLTDQATKNASQDDSVYEKELYPILRKIVEIDARYQVALSRAVLEWLQNPPPLKNKSAIQLFNLFTALADRKKFKRRGSSNDIDVQASRPYFYNLTDEEFQRRVVFEELVVENYYGPVAFPVPYPDMLSIIYPQEEFKQRIKEGIASVQLKARQVQKKSEYAILTNLHVFDEWMAELDTLYAADRVNLDDIKLINEIDRNLTIVLNISNPLIRGLLTSGPVDLKKAARQLGSETLFKERIAKRQALLEGRVEKIGEKCRLAYAMGRELLPTHRDLENFKPKLGELLETYRRSIRPYLSADTMGVVENEMAKWFPSFSRTQEQQVQIMKWALQRVLKRTQSLSTRLNKLVASPDRASLALTILMETESGNDPSAKVDDICSYLEPAILPDASVMEIGGFYIGPLVINPKTQAYGILYHEISHLLYGVLRDKDVSSQSQLWFDRSRACLMDNHTELSPEQKMQLRATMNILNTFIYDAEDWADLISAIVDTSPQLKECLYVRGLEDSDYSTMLLNGWPGDPHSGELHRLLHHEFLLYGEIPQICQQALIERGQFVHFNNCAEAPKKEALEFKSQ